jgi:iron complex outermembrane receptor protein
MTNYAGFGNVEWTVAPKVTVKAGARYTKSDRDAVNMGFDPGQGSTAAFFQNVLSPLYQQFVVGVPAGQVVKPTIPTFANYTLNPATGLPEVYRPTLDESNVSWSVGVNYKPIETILLYANVSKGYKAGSVGTISAAVWSAWVPVKQESLLDYEAGFKAQLLDHRLSLNGAFFYYDYKDKQVRAKFVDPFFGQLDNLVNVPKSQVTGGELELEAAPMRGLDLGLAATYLHSEVKQYVGVVGAEPDPNAPGFVRAVTQDFKASSKVRGFLTSRTHGGRSARSPGRSLWATP